MTVATIRTGYLNKYLGITNDADTLPWPSADRDIYIGQALNQSWPDLGKRATGTVATNQASDIYTIPAGITRVSRIELEQTAGGVTSKIDRVPHWQYHSDTQVRIGPIVATVSGLVLRFYGYAPYAADGSDIPARLEPAIAMRAAALAFGAMSGQLVNYRRQQGTDNPRVVDYDTAVGMSAYWERRYFEQIQKDVARVDYAPRRGRR